MSLGLELALRAVVIGAVSGVSCAILGCFLVLRRVSLLGDGISHGVLPGLVIGFLLGGKTNPVPLFVGAVTFGVLTAWLTQAVSSRGRMSEDAGLGIVFTALFAVGVLLISRLLRRVHFDADCVLYGSLGVTLDDTWPLLGLEVPRVLFTLVPTLLLVLLFVTLLWKELQLSSFDPALAEATGVSSTLMHYLLAAMVSWVTVASFEAVGSILVIALLIVPAATAQLLTERLRSMLLVSAVVAVVGAVVGVSWGRWLDVDYAGSVTVTLGGLFAVAVFTAPRHGVFSRLWSNFALSLRIASEDVLATLYRREERSGGTATWSYEECERVAGEGIVGRLAMHRCITQALVHRHPDGAIGLTDAGRDLGRSLVRSHRLWESYLDEHFELPPDHLHEPAERIEHYIGPELRERLAGELVRETDPHGRRIPDGEGDSEAEGDPEAKAERPSE